MSAVSATVGARSKWAGLGFALLSALAFGGSGPFGRPLMEAGLNPLEVIWIRLAGMALMMLPVAWVYRRLWLNHWRLLLGYGLIAIAGVQAFYFSSIARIPVGIGLLIEFLGPVLVLIWVAVVKRQRVARSAALGIFLSVLGLAALLEVWQGLVLDPIGLLLAGMAAVCQAGFFLLSDAASDDINPLGLVAHGGIVAFLAMTLIAQPWQLPWSVLAGSIQLAGIETSALVSVAWLALVSTSLAYWSGVAAIRRLTPTVAGGVAYLEVLVAIVLAWLLLSEALSPAQMLGGLIVLTGAYLAQRATPLHTGTVETPPPQETINAQGASQ